MKLRHSQSKFRRAMNKAKTIAAAGLVSGLMVLGGCQNQEMKPSTRERDCSLATDPVKRFGILTRKEMQKKWVSGDDVVFNTKSGDVIYRENFVGLDKNNEKVNGYSSLSVVIVDDTGVLLRSELVYCGYSVKYFRVDYGQALNAGFRKISAKKAADSRTAKLTIKPGITLFD